MIKTTTLAALAILVLVTGCQKDHVEECVQEAIKANHSPQQWSEWSSDIQADVRRDYRMECMKAAAGGR
jgi:hypothetical protein